MLPQNPCPSTPKKPKRRPRQREIAKKAVDGLSRFLRSRSKLVESPFPPRNKPGSRNSGPGPENRIAAGHVMQSFAFTMTRGNVMETHEHTGDFKEW